MSLPGFDDWLTDQDRWASFRYDEGPTEDDIINWQEANDYQNEAPENEE